jgi:hypothetical protein
MCTASASELLAKGSALSSLQIEQPVIEEFASDMHAYHLTQGQPITRQLAVKAAQPQHLQQHSRAAGDSPTCGTATFLPEASVSPAR